MAKYILKSGASLLKSGNTILTSSDDPPSPNIDINPANWGYPDGAAVPSFQSDDPARINFSSGSTGTFLANQLNGYPSLKLSGSNYYPTLALTTRTLFLVVKSDGPQPYQGTMISGGSGDHSFLGGSGSYWFDIAHADSIGNLNSPNRIFVNGLQAEPKSNATIASSFRLLSLDFANPDPLITSFHMLGGRRNYLPDYFNGSFVRIICYEKRLTEDHRRKIEQELKTLYTL